MERERERERERENKHMHMYISILLFVYTCVLKIIYSHYMDYWCSVSCNVALLKILGDVLQSNIPDSINLNTIMYTHYTTASGE